jgi:hypothetical protein
VLGERFDFVEDRFELVVARLVGASIAEHHGDRLRELRIRTRAGDAREELLTR